MTTKKEDAKKDAVASLEELEKAVARPKSAAAAPGAVPARKAASAAAPKARTAPANLRVRLVKSGICAPMDQKKTLRGLGLRRINREVIRPDNPSIRGMLLKVRHLVEVTAAK
jgi:large subunit ribosomal protein L30